MFTLSLIMKAHWFHFAPLCPIHWSPLDEIDRELVALTWVNSVEVLAGLKAFYMSNRLAFVPGVRGRTLTWSLCDNRGPRWWSFAKGREQGDPIGLGKTIAFYLEMQAKETVTMHKPIEDGPGLSNEEQRKYKYYSSFLI